MSQDGATVHDRFRDTDPAETQEWVDALNSVFKSGGVNRCKTLLYQVFARARSLGIGPSALLNSPYRNTISIEVEPPYPGDLELEERITAFLRWNALAMVVRANKESTELGGHLASYASAADLFEVGFNHFFRANGDVDTAQADLVFLQPHCGPGVYARAFLEGRLSEENLAYFRRETTGKGLCSYAHPWRCRNFGNLRPARWESESSRRFIRRVLCATWSIADWLRLPGGGCGLSSAMARCTSRNRSRRWLWPRGRT